MLNDLILNFATSKDTRKLEQVYRQIEKVGVGRYTANILVKEIKKEKETKQ